MLLLLSANFFSNLTFSNIYFRNTIRVSNFLDPHQDWHSVSPSLGPNPGGGGGGKYSNFFFIHRLGPSIYQDLEFQAPPKNI